MSRTAEALVIGGGIMGCSTAYALAKAGVKTTLVERNLRPGRETTARSGAIIRAHYGVPELVTLALEANHRYIRFAEEVGGDCGFRQCGYCVLVDEADVDTLRANTTMHQALGVHVDLVEPEEVAARVPGVRTEDIALAAWEPEGGYASPDKTVAAYAERACEHGAELLFGSPVVSAQRAGTGWSVALADGETITAEQVVLCTGNWSRPIGALFGLELPVTPVRAQIVVAQRPAGTQADLPVLSDLTRLAYFRSDGADGLWVGSSDMADLKETLPAPDGFQETVDAPALSAARKKVASRFSGVTVGDVGIQRAFCGLYETTPDWQPIIDTFDPHLHVAVGFSGHGFKLAPVVGEILAGRVTGSRPIFDTEIFTLARFAQDRPIRSQRTYQRARFLR